MRFAVGLVLAAVALVACTTGSAGPAQTASLAITYWADSANASEKTKWTLRCGPAAGTFPRPVRACTRLLNGGMALFAPIPKNVACTEIYGGPQKARIVGTFRSRSVYASFSRTNGCHISRWDRLSPWLLPAGGAS